MRERRYKCRYCNKQFTSSKALSRHVREDHRIRYYAGYLLPVMGILSIIGVIVVAASIFSEPPLEVSGVPCTEVEGAAYHAHVGLSIYYNGSFYSPPAGIGVRGDCIFWLHTHDADGVIHVEPGRDEVYTLGQFLDIWGVDIYNASSLGFNIGGDYEVIVYVNGEPYQGNPRNIILSHGDEIVIEYREVGRPT